MGHLAFFFAGIFTQTVMYQKVYKLIKKIHKQLAIVITDTCHESDVRTETHIGPETFHFATGNEAIAKSDGEKYYLLRPEVVEAFFYLWRLTREKKKRN